MMRLVLLADAGSPHTAKWAREFAKRGWDVHVISLRMGGIPDVEVHTLLPMLPGKLGYLTVAKQVKELVYSLQPDILHAHYATSYGLLGAMTEYHPFVVSVWGSDVYDFPRQGPIQKALLKRNLAKADAISSTSHAMAHVTMRYAGDAPIEVIPFGVDLGVFTPGEEPEIPTIGCAKLLEPKYGQEVLIRALRIIVERDPNRPLRLMLAGDGSTRNHLETLARDLAMANRTHFLGHVPHDEIPRFMRGLTLFAMPSVEESESFGVAAVEAASCGLPVVASWVGGIGEVVLDEVTGLLVPPNDPVMLADALERLLDDASLRAEMGANGRALVRKAYDWTKNADQMEALYHTVMEAQPHSAYDYLID